MRQIDTFRQIHSDKYIQTGAFTFPVSASNFRKRDVAPIQYLRMISLFGAVAVGLWLPLRTIGFIAPFGIEIIADLAISLISMLNIYLNFKTTRANPLKIRTWLHFGIAIDAICVFPLSVLGLFLTGNWSYLMLFKLLTARHIRYIKPFLDDFDTLSPLTYRLVPLIFSMPMIVHLIACGWIILGSGTVGPDADLLTTYVRAMYWTFTTLTTVGYGDISAKTIPQMLFTCGVEVTGVAFFGYILSNVASLLSRLDAAREHHMDSLDKIETFMRTHEIPTDLRSNVRSYYHYLWQSKKGYHDNSLLEGLPTKIHSELFFHINRTIIEKVPFLKGADQDLIEDLMTELEPRIFIPGERVFRAGENGDALYFIHSGSIDILTAENKQIAQLQEGAFFGEMALISEQPRSATAKASTFCDVYQLKKEAFARVIEAYPEFLQHIKDVVNVRKAG